MDDASISAVQPTQCTTSMRVSPTLQKANIQHTHFTASPTRICCEHPGKSNNCCGIMLPCPIPRQASKYPAVIRASTWQRNSTTCHRCALAVVKVPTALPLVIVHVLLAILPTYAAGKGVLVRAGVPMKSNFDLVVIAPWGATHPASRPGCQYSAHIICLAARQHNHLPRTPS